MIFPSPNLRPILVLKNEEGNTDKGNRPIFSPLSNFNLISFKTKAIKKKK